MSCSNRGEKFDLKNEVAKKSREPNRAQNLKLHLSRLVWQKKNHR